jgi:hypothetical protein
VEAIKSTGEILRDLNHALEAQPCA